LLERQENWQEIEKKVYMSTVNRVPITLVRGEGLRVWDTEEREYLDFVGVWGIVILSLLKRWKSSLAH
jgi:acetylornithine/N-succinyldiaminopimelate aminotransferase